MSLHITATYQVRSDTVDQVKIAIEKFTDYIKNNESGTKLYMAWQDENDSTKFTHVIIFENEEARTIHSNSEAVKKFEEVYAPALSHGPVLFTHYEEVATNK